jgi:2-hydroxychromene-2-carboxylate isomerase
VSDAVFYYDVMSPYAWLAAERIDQVFAGPVEWQPIFLGGIFKARGRGSWAMEEPETRAAGIAEVERRADRYGLPELTWPALWPTNSLAAMRVATWATQHDRGRAFALAACRTAFVQGRDLAEFDAVLDAAEQAGIERDQATAAAEDPAIKQALRETTDAALERGVIGVPTVWVGGEAFWGDDRLEEAAAAAGR